MKVEERTKNRWWKKVESSLNSQKCIISSAMILPSTRAVLVVISQ